MNNAASFLDQLLRSGADLLQPANASKANRGVIQKQMPAGQTATTKGHATCRRLSRAKAGPLSLEELWACSWVVNQDEKWVGKY